MDDVQQELLEEIRCRNGADREVRVIWFRFIVIENTEMGLRKHLGAQGWKTASGEPVRCLGRDLYEVVSSGDLLERVS